MNTHRFSQDTERYALSNELHARPFPTLTAPCRAIFLAIQPDAGAQRTLLDDRQQLISLLDRYGAQHPAADARHYTGELGRALLKWESHTEFVTYTFFAPGIGTEPFASDVADIVPQEWFDGVGGTLISATQVHVAVAASAEEAEAVFVDKLSHHFAAESLATGFVIEDEALVATDFRIHEDGLARIAVLAIDGVGPRRLGRVVQRLLEIESYKSLALLALPVARKIADRVTELDKRLAEIKARDDDPRDMLHALTDLASEVEYLSTDSAFRFGAAGAYEAIVHDRITAIRERRLRGRQLYSEFMTRRFDPAMRTCRSAEQRLKELSDRVARASSLLSTRVNVAVEAQNQALLESMDRRAALQLRLQQTVEGLSVVAISYYAVSLLAYIATPVAKTMGLDKASVIAAIVPIVVSVVWIAIRKLTHKT